MRSVLVVFPLDFPLQNDTIAEIVAENTVPPCEDAVGLTGSHVERTAISRSLTIRTETVLRSITLSEGLDMIRDCWNSAGECHYCSLAFLTWVK